MESDLSIRMARAQAAAEALREQIRQLLPALLRTRRHPPMGTREVPDLDLGTPGGVASLLKQMLWTDDDQGFLSDVVAQLDLDGIVASRATNARVVLEQLNQALLSSHGLQLPGPDALREGDIAGYQKVFLSCDTIVDSQQQEHLSALFPPPWDEHTQAKVDAWVQEHNQLARTGTWRTWEGAAWNVVASDDRAYKPRQRQGGWTHRLAYLMFQQDTASLVNTYCPHKELAARVRDGKEALCGQLLAVYDTMSCHADAATLGALLAADEPEVHVLEDADYTVFEALRVHVEGHGAGGCYRLTFPGHSMVMVTTGEGCDFYESVAGHGPGDCMLTKVMAEKPRQASLATVLEGLQRLGNPDVTERTAGCKLAFGFSHGALNLELYEPNEIDFTWSFSPLATAEVVAERVREQADRMAAILDFLTRYPFDDGVFFLVHGRESLWTIKQLDSDEDVPFEGLTAGKKLRFKLAGTQSAERCVVGKVVGAFPDAGGHAVAVEPLIAGAGAFDPVVPLDTSRAYGVVDLARIGFQGVPPLFQLFTLRPGQLEGKRWKHKDTNTYEVSAETWPDSITQSFRGDGDANGFTLDRVPDPASVVLAVDGAPQAKGFTIDGDELRFDEAPVDGVEISITYMRANPARSLELEFTQV